ncbi:unnamed protein product [Trichogramma brassicae]|uniref:Uncharacterized protein n=1 Tax=Trichogramma brassicae TaxID=86971 RepID=A0A6H5I3M0_9HYME|nr:unnamed protein product [Trichogramma brassicae]
MHVKSRGIKIQYITALCREKPKSSRVRLRDAPIGTNPTYTHTRPERYNTFIHERYTCHLKEYLFRPRPKKLAIARKLYIDSLVYDIMRRRREKSLLIELYIHLISMSMREKVNWEIEDERHEFLSQLEPLIKYWNHRLPDLRDVFRWEEIDLLLKDSVDLRKIRRWHAHYYEGEQFIDFVIRCGYKDEPGFDEDGKPLLRRTTAVHRVARRKHPICSDGLDHKIFVIGSELVRKLFKIYERFDVNFSDEDGLTHFHAACHYGCYDELEKFIELGQDPDCLPRESNASSVDPPLYSAIKNDEKMFKFLLKNGADPTVVNAKGLTLLHSLCTFDRDRYSLKRFFELTDDAQKKVSIDLLDKFGRTPLQWAVSNLAMQTVDTLLDRGADLSKFIFPTEINFKVDPKYKDWWPESNKLGLASRALIVIERLEKRGYQLNRSGALTVMKFFSKYELFEKLTDLEEYKMFGDEEFLVESLQAMLRRVDWNSNESRHGFLREFDSSIASFNQIHSHGSIFQSGEIDRLLIDCIHCTYEGANAHDARKRFIRFVIGIGYRDEAEIQGGAQTIQRTTAIHHAARLEYHDLVEELFKIYGQFKVNYSDESGLTHFHAASMAGCHSVVRNFCQFGQDINCVWRETGDTPIRLAMDRRQDKVASFLILRVARDRRS